MVTLEISGTALNPLEATSPLGASGWRGVSFALKRWRAW